MTSRPAADEYLKAAVSIAAELCREAYWVDGACNWVGRSPMEAVDLGVPITPTVSALGPDLYGGTAGVGLFLARVHALTGHAATGVTAEGAIRQACSRGAALPPKDRLGFYSGLTGIAYAAVHVGALTGSEEIQRRGLELAAQALEEPGDDDPLDLIGGAAGAVCALLVLDRLTGQPVFGDAAVRLGERLVEAAIKTDGTWSWESARATGASMGPRALTGLAHGAAGCGLALVELYARTGRPEFLEGAYGAFAYEDACFDPERENWPDLRSFEGADGPAPRGQPSFMTAWCYGAPGIGLSRLRALELVAGGDEGRVLRARAEAAVRHTARRIRELRAEPVSDATPCHGLAGLTELLIVAGRVLPDPSALKVARQAWKAALRQRAARGAWATGVASGGKNQSLMLGTAGIGYALLRIWNPEAVPSVLLVTTGMVRTSPPGMSREE